MLKETGNISLQRKKVGLSKRWGLREKEKRKGREKKREGKKEGVRERERREIQSFKISNHCLLYLVK